MKKVIFGGLLFIGGAIMYSIGTLGFADMDVQANYMLAPQYIGKRLITGTLPSLLSL